MQGLYDSTTDLIAIQGSICNTCEGQKYDIEPRVKSGAATIDFSKEIRTTYGDFTLGGHTATDKICAFINACAEVKFLYVDGFGGVSNPNVDGIIGLAKPNKPFKIAPDQVLDTPSDFFLDKLSLTSSQFSTRLSTTQVSWIDFGAPDTTELVNGVTIEGWEDYFYSLPLDALRIGKLPVNTYSFEPNAQVDLFPGIEGVYTIFDTATPDIYLTKLYYDSFITELYGFLDLEFTVTGGYPYATCTTTYPDLYLSFKKTWLQVKAADYTEDVSTAQDGSLCKMKIRPIDAPFNIMGLPLYQDYYVVHDFASNAMTFSPHS